VWALTSEESLFLNNKFKVFYPKLAEPEWCWLRYRIRVKDCLERSQWPLHFVLLGDECAPWTHENFLILQRTALAEPFDVWIKLPMVQRFNTDYLKLYAETILKTIQARLPKDTVDLLSLPQESSYTFADIGPARFPVYLQSFKPLASPFANVYFDGPEQWDSYNWSARFSHQEKIRHKVLSYWLSQQQKKKSENSQKQENP
jgi:hypothetical protein